MISENLISVRSNEESSIWSHVTFLNFKCMHSWTLRACKLYWHSKVALLVCRETIVSSEYIALFNFKHQRFFKDYDIFNHRFSPLSPHRNLKIKTRCAHDHNILSFIVKNEYRFQSITSCAKLDLHKHIYFITIIICFFFYKSIIRQVALYEDDDNEIVACQSARTRSFHEVRCLSLSQTTCAERLNGKSLRTKVITEKKNLWRSIR